MAIISFSKTESELLTEIKTVTRRDWADAHRRRFQQWYDEGKRTHQAWNQLPFLDGAQQIATIRLTERPYLEPLQKMDDQDLLDEGGMVETVDAFCDLIGLAPSDEVTVVEFELVRLHSNVLL